MGEGDVAHIPSGHSRKVQGPGRDLVNDRLEAQYKHLCKEPADRMLVLAKKHNFIGILVVGPERLVGFINKNFPSSFRERVVSVPEDLGKFSAATILHRLEPVIASCELKRQLADVENLLAGNRGTVVEPYEVFARLQDGTLRNIVVTSSLVSGIALETR